MDQERGHDQEWSDGIDRYGGRELARQPYVIGRDSKMILLSRFW